LAARGAAQSQRQSPSRQDVVPTVLVANIRRLHLKSPRLWRELDYRYRRASGI
jgi:hypothetical protein